MLDKGLDLKDFSSTRKRPFLVTMLAVLVLTITIINLVRFVNTLISWNFLASLPGVPPLYLAVTGLIGFLIGLPLFWGLWIGNPRAPGATRIATLLYLSYVWIERIVLSMIGNRLANWPFTVSMTLIIILFVFWALSRSKVKAYFGDINEQSS